MRKKKYDVFISYSQKDREAADKICLFLDQHNISYFIDRKSLYGADGISEIIADAILNSTIFLFLGSKNSYDSHFACDEVSFAKKHLDKNHILAYLLDQEPMPFGIELSLSNTLWREHDSHPFYPVVINDIKLILAENKDKRNTMDNSEKNSNGKKRFIRLILIPAAIILCISLPFFRTTISPHVKIDNKVQTIFDSLLIKQMIDIECPEIFGAVMEVETGNLLAVSSWGKNKDYVSRIKNRVFLDLFDPGSTFQVVSYAALLESGLIPPLSKIEIGQDDSLEFNYRGKEIRDIRSSDFLSRNEAIIEGSNIAIVKMVLGAFELHPNEYLEAITNLGWEETPLMVHKGDTLRKSRFRRVNDSTWSKISLAQISYGYELLCTPMHTLMFYNSVANNGVRPGVGRICSESTAKQIQKVLEDVVEIGTACTIWADDGTIIQDGAKSSMVKIAGKTGLAQVFANGSYSGSNGYYDTFVGYFPAERPKYSCLVTLKTVPGGYFGKPNGGYMAGPVVKQLAEQLLY